MLEKLESCFLLLATFPHSSLHVCGSWWSRLHILSITSSPDTSVESLGEIGLHNLTGISHFFSLNRLHEQARAKAKEFAALNISKGIADIKTPPPEAIRTLHGVNSQHWMS